MKKISFAFLFCACSFLGAAEIENILAFKNSGDSSAWYHELILDAYNPEKMAAAEELVLRAMSNPEISDEAFRLCAKILKPSASLKSLKVLPTLLTKDAHVMPVFDVLISFENPKVDEILLKLLNSKDKNVAIHSAYALGIRGKTEASQPLFNLAKSKDKNISDSAIIALGHIGGSDAAKALKALAKARNTDKFLVNNALAEVREKFIAQKNMKAALEISLSEEFRPGLLSLAKLRGIKEMDKLFAGENEVSRNAARIANTGRTYENSSELLSKFDKLSDGAKAAAIRSFGLSGDKKFLKIISPLLKDKNDIVSIEAVYACAYIGDSSVADKLAELAVSKDGSVYRPARYSLVFMNEPIDKILEAKYADKKDFRILEVLINRGNDKYRKELISRFFDENDSDRSDIIKVLERQVGYIGLSEMAEGFNKASDGVRKDCLRIFIKALSRDSDIDFRNKVFEETLSKAKFTEKELDIIKTRVLSKPKKNK